MATCIIIHNIDNDSLLRFTETKLFFDAKNNTIDLFTNLYIVDNIDKISNLQDIGDLVVVIKTGYFLTTTYREKIKNKKGVYIVDSNDPDVIYFDEDTIISLKKKSKYKSPSKQNYIIENMLKTVINSKRMLYCENTEDYNFMQYPSIKNLYGLASGWKTIKLAKDIGLENLDNIIVYDYNNVQLEYAKQIHSQTIVDNDITFKKYKVGEYSPPSDIKDFLKLWQAYPVQFELIDLFDTPRFKDNSLVWVSNAFMYEPNIFFHGWQESRNKRKRLINDNPSCIVIES